MFALFLPSGFFLRAIIVIDNWNPTKLGRTSIEKLINYNAMTLPLSNTLRDRVIFAEKNKSLTNQLGKFNNWTLFKSQKTNSIIGVRSTHQKMMPSTNATGAIASIKSRAEGLVLMCPANQEGPCLEEFLLKRQRMICS